MEIRERLKEIIAVFGRVNPLWRLRHFGLFSAFYNQRLRGKPRNRASAHMTVGTRCGQAGLVDVLSQGASLEMRAYWFAGMHLAHFVDRLESHGFYLVGKNTTPAKHLGISEASVKKMIAFYRRYSDPFKIDVSVRWCVYRNNKESRDSCVGSRETLAHGKN